jgi:hypothetical protein
MQMDPRLAELYGTNQDESDVEKLAAAQLAEDLADDGDIDLDDVDEDDLEALAQSVLDDGDEDDDEGEEKLAEADFLGRVMAHAYVQEMRGIEKGAAKDDRSGKFGKAGKLSKRSKKGRLGLTIGGHVRAKGRKLGRALAGGRGAAGFKERVLGRAGQRGKVWGARGGAAGLAGAAGYGAYRGLRKESSAFETLAIQRAEEMLDEGGVSDSSPYDVLGAAVERRALEILAANGYEVE